MTSNTIVEIQTQYISRLHTNITFAFRLVTLILKGNIPPFPREICQRTSVQIIQKWSINRIKSKLISLEIGFKLLSALNWLSKNFHRKIIILKMKQRTIPLEVRQLRKIFQLKASKTWLLFTFQLNFWIIDVKAKYRLLSRVYK